MTVLHLESRYGFPARLILVWVVIMCLSGVFMTGEICAKESSVVAKATFGGGCFWCTEAVYTEIRGVTGVTSGYTGGRIPNPNYKQVCSGLTGHAEAVEVEYNPQLVSFETLIDIFFELHDPTTMNRQGPDYGTQYRSAAYFSNSEEKEIIKNKIDALNESGKFSSKVVTEVEALSDFYSAEEYHQDYYKKRGIVGCAI